MIVRVVVYEAESMEAAKEWHRKRAPEIKQTVGLERIEFIRQSKPPRAGAIMYFESPEELRVYKDSGRREWLRESMVDSWATDARPLRDTAYRLMEVPEAPPNR